MLWLNHCYGCCWNYLGSSHLIWGYNACFPDFTKLTLCLLATKKEISAIDNSNKWLSGIFERQDQLSLPPLWRTEEQIKATKTTREKRIRAIYPTKNILQIQVFRWYEKLIRNLAQIQSWRFLCTGGGWTLIKGKKKTLFYSLELSASINSADYFIIMMVLFTNFFYMFLTIIMTQSFENKYTVCI